MGGLVLVDIRFKPLPWVPYTDYSNHDWPIQ